MGMYTEFVFGAELKKDVPEEVINILKSLFLQVELNVTLPDHNFFKCGRWSLISSMCSYYFGYPRPLSNLYFDDISKTYRLAIRSSIKNYNNEIENFINWINPYIESGSGVNDFLGYSIYEEDEKPELYFKRSCFDESL